MRKKKVRSEFVGNSKVMRCSRYGNWGRRHMILNGEPLEEVDCFKCPGSQDMKGMWYTDLMRGIKRGER